MMRCPFCKIDSMRPVEPGRGPVDQCVTCGAAWFDPGEIRELTEGRFPGAGGSAEGGGPLPGGKEGGSARVARAWKESVSLSCPRCTRGFAAVDFQNTGTPVFHCRGCGGLLVPRDAVGELAGKFGLQRKNAALYEALGESLAGEVRHRLEREYGPDAKREISGEVGAPGIPVVVPLSDSGDRPASYPAVTWGLLALLVVTHLLCGVGIAGMDKWPSRFALPSGIGFAGVPASALWLAPFFHGGILPLATGCIFLYVLGDNVEDRMGRVPFLLFFLACGMVAGTAHVLWGKPGASAALGSAGAVAGVLGAYLVFFPQVPIAMYRGGDLVSVPAYLFACAWVMAQFLWGWGPLSDVLNPAPYSLAGSLAGFAAGAAGAALWRSMENPGP